MLSWDYKVSNCNLVITVFVSSQKANFLSDIPSSCKFFVRNTLLLSVRLHDLNTPSSLVHGDGVELLEAGEGLRAEGLVDLELVDVGEGLSGLGHHGADGGHGADAHDLGVAPGDAVTDDSEERDGIFL